MPTRDSPSPGVRPSAKRRRQASPSQDDSDFDHDSTTGRSKAGQCASFRNVSACTRCRMRKNRCDQRLPSCASCAKAGVACVGDDPITKRAIPRSYVFYLESRVEQLENILISHDISFPSSENLDLLCSASQGKDQTKSSTKKSRHADESPSDASDVSLVSRDDSRMGSELSEFSLPKSGWLASVSGVSFSSLVFTALQQPPSKNAEANTTWPARRRGPEMRGGMTKSLGHSPTVRNTLPPKTVAMRLANLYFEHVNPHIPILHRGDLMGMLHNVYDGNEANTTSRELYIVNMVFAMGCDVTDTVADSQPGKHDEMESKLSLLETSGTNSTPEDYYLKAIVHLEACLTGTNGGLEVLQAILMLANFALLRPVPPGLRYITGVAVCLAIDLGLHQEDSDDADDADALDSDKTAPRETTSKGTNSEHGRSQWTRDLRRRLWWCTYTFDRLVSTCVGRPFGINEHAITTELPSLLDDDYITESGFIEPPHANGPSYKHASHHHFRLHLLQSEIVQVLQFNQGKVARAAKKRRNYSAQTNTPCPFIAHFDSFGSWLVDMEKRLHLWRASTPTSEETGVAYSTLFLELGYWQAVILLHGKRGSNPALKKALYRKQNGRKADRDEDTDQSHLKVAEAGQKVIRLYRQLHLQGLIRYTYISTHQLFVAGMSYLEAIHSSETLRGRVTLDEVDFTVLAAKSVFADMEGKCPQASAYLDVFDQMARATIKIVSATSKRQEEIAPTGLSSMPSPLSRRTHVDNTPLSLSTEQPSLTPAAPPNPSQPAQQLAMPVVTPLSGLESAVDGSKDIGFDPYWDDAFNGGGVLDTFDALFFGS